MTSSTFQDEFSRATELDPESRRVCVELYRQLADGEPVLLDDLAAALAVRVVDVKDALDQSSLSAAEYDEEGRVVAFGGLTLKPTSHRFRVGDQTLFTWCAFDTLFLPRILNKSARVESTCPVTGRQIHLTVTPDGVEECEPEAAFMSLVTPGAGQLEGSIRGSFCCHVHFFASEQAASAWLPEREAAFALPVREASKVAQTVTDRRFKDTLHSSGERGVRVASRDHA